MDRHRRRLAVGLFRSSHPGAAGRCLCQERILRQSTKHNRGYCSAFSAVWTIRLPQRYVHADADDGRDVHRAERADGHGASDTAALARSHPARFLLSVLVDIGVCFPAGASSSNLLVGGHRPPSTSLIPNLISNNQQIIMIYIYSSQ